MLGAIDTESTRGIEPDQSLQTSIGMEASERFSRIDRVYPEGSVLMKTCQKHGLNVDEFLGLALKAAIKLDKYKGKCKFHQDKHLIDGKSFTINSLDQLPSKIDVASTCQKSNNGTIAFYGSHSIFSNTHNSGYEAGGTR